MLCRICSRGLEWGSPLSASYFCPVHLVLDVDVKGEAHHRRLSTLRYLTQPMEEMGSHFQQLMGEESTGDQFCKHTVESVEMLLEL